MRCRDEDSREATLMGAVAPACARLETDFPKLAEYPVLPDGVQLLCAGTPGPENAACAVGPILITDRQLCRPGAAIATTFCAMQKTLWQKHLATVHGVVLAFLMRPTPHPAARTTPPHAPTTPPASGCG
ncbi:protein of unknown function [Bradyrhizobium vignae]|uniref:Uncharacterized protein n=1 Tax=Bradyrhizobium vignae TaxID=1549949 RepID=A0A2U3Q1V3_9BRAD|nr:protein of unknown function [Bradyrhizobium vignae]